MTAAPTATNERFGQHEPAEVAQRWPAHRFYWSILDAPGVPVRSPRPAAAAALDLNLAHDLPLPIDEVHAVYARLDDHRVLACAALRTDLASLEPGVLRVSPDGLPDVLAGKVAVSPDSINLLVGDFEPWPIRRARAVRAAWIAGAITLVGLLVSIGLLRRASALTADASEARQAAHGAMLAALPEEPVTSAILPLRLKAELDQLRRTRRPAARPDATADGTAGLASLLNTWPANLLARTEIVSVSSTAMSMNVRVDGDPQPLLDGLGQLPGWRRDEPRVTRSGQGTMVTVQYRKERGP